MLAVDLIIREGPADFNMLRIYEQLGIDAATVGFYFGGRDGLLADATWWAFRLWAQNVDDAFRTARPDPRARLRSFVEAEVTWARRMQGMHFVVNYPHVSSQAGDLVLDRYGDQLTSTFEYHLALLSVTVRDINRGTVHPLDFGPGNLPRAEFVLTPGYLLTATQISWATHGLATWSAGRHVPTRGLASRAFGDVSTTVAVSKMVSTIVALAEPS